MPDLTCKKCCCSRTGDVLGAPCQTPGCGGVIEVQPPFSELVDVLPEPMTCGRRAENPHANSSFPGPDHWQKFKTNGNRVCSFCGSLHPDDFFAMVKASAAAPADAEHLSVVEIEPSTKSYKIYVHQPGVRNAMEGGIKFYTQHLPHPFVNPDQEQEYKRAVAVSHARFEKYLANLTKVAAN